MSEIGEWEAGVLEFEDGEQTELSFLINLDARIIVASPRRLIRHMGSSGVVTVASGKSYKVFVEGVDRLGIMQ